LNEDDINNVVWNEELEEVKQNIGENVPQDDINDDMIRNDDIYDDADMAKLFNINFELDE